MNRKKFSSLVACLLLSLPFLTQAVHAKPPKKTPPASTSSTASANPERITTESTASCSQCFPNADEVTGQTSSTASTNTERITIKSTASCSQCFPKADEVTGQTRCEEPIFFRNNNMTISGNEQNHPKLYLKWLTISQADVTFENLDIEGKIHVTAGAKITFKNCTINGTPVDNSMPDNECGVEIFAGSSGVFEKCILQGGTRTCVAVRDDRSNATFSDCTISNTISEKSSGILVMNKGSSIVTQCKFLNCKRFAVYLYNDSTADINECEFQDPNGFNGKAILALKHCKATVRKSKFSGCKNGAIFCSDFSNMNVEECNFNDLQNDGVSGINKCKIFVSNCNFKNIQGNGVAYKDSEGMTRDCSFDAIKLAAIAIGEMNSNPKISNCVINGNTELFHIVIRNRAKPILENITFKEFSSDRPLISCSDFAEPTITNLQFTCSDKLPRIMVYNDAIIKEASMSNRKILFVNYNEATQYHSILNNENLIKQFDPSQYIVVEKKVGGKFEAFDVNTCEELTVPPSMVSPKSENANTSLTEPIERFVFRSCAHTANICPDCGNMCKIDMVDGQFRRVCGICNSESPTYFCSLCETPNQQLLKVFEAGTCVICCENPATCIVLPCGHKNLCDECSQKYYSQDEEKKCPECICPVTSFKHDFFNNK